MSDTSYWRTVLFTTLIMCLTVTLFDRCAPGEARPIRKKMPELALRDEQWESSDGTTLDQDMPGDNYPSAIFPASLLRDTVLGRMGEQENYLALDLSSRTYDQWLPLIKAYEQQALTYVNAWQALGKAGVLIDLGSRTNENSGGHRADLLLEYPARHFTLPLIVCWDAASADRAELLLQTLQSLDDITIKHVN